ncbi:uncharacterized protein LOC134669806 [Cydia fagiglandana]|uniref:uncharacterized protein LOC134669806 n=1 Tax=Cydia fagiglandana TaxID=1458189 RepID=UPI002FEE4BDE
MSFHSMQNQEKWCEFLDLYRENTCLWDIQSNTYMRRDLRNASYNLLLEKYREIEPNATLDMVKKKIDIFRTGYRREVKKINESRVNSTSSGYEYKPTLWYFDKLTFLDFQGDISDIKDSYESDDQAIEYIDLPVEYPEEEEEPDPVVKYRLKMRNVNPKPRPRPRQRPYAREQNSPPCDSKQPSFPGEAEDDCASYCSSLKLQMRELDTQQKFIAQKLISDVIFLARTSQLTLDSSILINSSDN